MKDIVIRLISCLILFGTMLAHAAGDLKAGQEKSLVCGACHGAQGQSINPEWPHLAGQYSAYLIKQLHDFKQDQTRNAPTMSPMAINLTDQDIEDLAAYYAIQPPPRHQAGKINTRGETLYRQGDLNKHITACIACHGPDGQGNGQAGFPRICGQQSIYTIQQLQAFKTQKRHNDLNSIMRDICSHLEQGDMEALAHYLETLH